MEKKYKESDGRETVEKMNQPWPAPRSQGPASHLQDDGVQGVGI